MYSCLHFLISSASVMSLPFLSFIVPILAWNVNLDISDFPEEIFSLSHSIVFLYFFYCSFKEAFLSLFVVLWNSAFNWICLSLSPLPFASLLSSAICKASSDNLFVFLPFFSFGMILVSASYIVRWTFVHSSLGTLHTRSSSLCLSITSSV